VVLATLTGPQCNFPSRHRDMRSIRTAERPLENQNIYRDSPSDQHHYMPIIRILIAAISAGRTFALQSSHGQRYGSSTSHSWRVGGELSRLAPRGHRRSRRPGSSRSSYSYPATVS
jgi:hypothetical protein